jgi:hypothetical protein
VAAEVDEAAPTRGLAGLLFQLSKAVVFLIAAYTMVAVLRGRVPEALRERQEVSGNGRGTEKGAKSEP